MSKIDIPTTKLIEELGRRQLKPEHIEMLKELISDTRPVVTENLPKEEAVAEAEDTKPTETDIGTDETVELSPEQQAELLSNLEARLIQKFEYYKRPEGVNFADVKKSLQARPDLMYSLAKMEETGGMPDIIVLEDDVFVFGDCSQESPEVRRNLTYDEALKMAKKFKVEMMDENVYIKLQKLGKFDIDTQSWIKTSDDEIKEGYASYGDEDSDESSFGADFIDYRDEDRGWRGVLRVPKV